MKQTHQLEIDKLDEHLRQLIAEICQYPPGCLNRHRGLNQIIRMIQKSGKLWRGGDPEYYEDALQQTWLYFCRNLCEATTADQYDPERGSVITWLNSYLKYRLKDGGTKVWEEAVQRVVRQVSESDELLDPVENLPAPPEPQLILEEILIWLEKDPGGELHRHHIRNHPEITCQVLIRRRLPPRTPWQKLAAEFNVPVATLSSFYQRQCFPRLLNFGKQQGYILED